MWILRERMPFSGSECRCSGCRNLRSVYAAVETLYDYKVISCSLERVHQTAMYRQGCFRQGCLISVGARVPAGYHPSTSPGT